MGPVIGVGQVCVAAERQSSLEANKTKLNKQKNNDLTDRTGQLT